MPNDRYITVLSCNALFNKERWTQGDGGVWIPICGQKGAPPHWSLNEVIIERDIKAGNYRSAVWVAFADSMKLNIAITKDTQGNAQPQGAPSGGLNI
jgi:hypothetical protein